MTRILHRDRRDRPALTPPRGEAVELHRTIPGYRPSPLVGLPALAERIGAARVDVKVESDRYGLPSFKIMGASWAAVEALRPWLPPAWRPGDGLDALAGKLPSLTLVAATDGNHGRALARVGALLGLGARILVPSALSAQRIADIEAEGAEVVVVDGTYDDAVAASAAGKDGDVLVSDTSWPGYERVPGAVIDGYATILAETAEQLVRPPDLVIVQLGVGAFGAAVLRHFRTGGRDPAVVGVEPTTAACVMASLAAGRLVTVPGPHDSVMAGLNCGTPSLVAWPVLQTLDAVLALDDDAARQGVRVLGEHGIAAGECSGVAVAAAEELLTGPDRARLGLPERPSVLLFATEGITDEAAHAAATGQEQR
ncbi:diaminopropionate ammonia-lyase [Pseudonocardia zijingensis]|jgi:diaminopropionate ammonia-lyase|uniref:Diaminopropionate ammonia-lyase n=1 Tax=Pseudonocardia zijingensis TaxID=153376 RepID=A0ABN1N6Y9_9PSEU